MIVCCLGQCRKRGRRGKGRGKERGERGVSARDRSGRSRANEAHSRGGSVEECRKKREGKRVEGRERDNGQGRR